LLAVLARKDRRLFASDDTVEVKRDFAIDNSADPFDETVRFIILLPAADDFVARSSRRHQKRRLVDNLAASIEIGNDEVAGGPVREHAAGISIVVRLNPGETRQQSVMQVDDPPAGVLPAACRGQDAHVSRQHDEVDFVLVANRD
jgi:hypothetical protein